MLGIIVRESDLKDNDYVHKSQLKKRKSISAKRPDGKRVQAKDAFLMDGSWINEFSLEYLAAEFTRDCNVSCGHCYVAANRGNAEDPQYIDLRFIMDLAEALNDSPSGRKREICITGGEPTIDQKKLKTRYAVLDEIVENKNITIASNLLAVPIDSVGNFFSTFDDAMIQASYSPYLEKQYEMLAEKGGMENRVPSRVHPKDSLLEKIRMFDDYAHEHAKKFIIRVNGIGPEDLAAFQDRAASYLGSKGRCTSDFIYSTRVIGVGNGKNLKGVISAEKAAIACSQSEELYMCINGDLYPTVNHIDNKGHRIGTIARL